MAAFWFLMLLVGGTKNLGLAIAAVGVNMLMAVLMGFNRKRIKVYENGGEAGKETWADKLADKLVGKKDGKKNTITYTSATKKKKRKKKKKSR